MTVGEASRKYTIALEHERSICDAAAGLCSFDTEVHQARSETETAHAQLVDAIFEGECAR